MLNILVDNQHQCRATELMIENSEVLFQFILLLDILIFIS